MKKLALLLVALLAIPAAAQNTFYYPKADPARISVTRDLEFRKGLKLDLYRPSGDAVVPLVVFANVGSLNYTTWAFYQGWSEATAAAGMAAIVYQATQPTATADFDAMIAFLRERASDYRIDPTRVVIWAASANVRLGLPLAMDRSRDYIRGAVLYYGTGEAPEIRTDLPVQFVRAGLDSTQLNDDIDKLLARALASNAPWSIESYGGGLHGFEVLNDTEITRGTIHRSLSFMKFVMRPELTAAYRAASDDAQLGAAFNRGEWSTAVDGYRKRVAANPADGETHRRLGIALNGSKQYEEALVHLEKAWELGRRGPRDTAWPASEAAAGAGNLARTIHWLDTLLSSQFGPPVTDIRNSDAYARVRSTAEFEALLTGIEKQQKLTAALDGADIAAAILELKTAREERLQREGVLVNLAYRLLGRGKVAESVEVFQIATKRYPGSANAWESLSEAYEAAGDKKSALSAARKALTLIEKDSALASTGRDLVRTAATDRISRLSL